MMVRGWRMCEWIGCERVRGCGERVRESWESESALLESENEKVFALFFLSFILVHLSHHHSQNFFKSPERQDVRKSVDFASIPRHFASFWRRSTSTPTPPRNRIFFRDKKKYPASLRRMIQTDPELLVCRTELVSSSSCAELGTAVLFRKLLK